MVSHNLGYTGTVEEYCLKTGADIFVTSRGMVLPMDSYLCSGFDYTETYSTDSQTPAIALKIHPAIEAETTSQYDYIVNNNIAFFKRKRYRKWIPIGEIPNLDDITDWGEVINCNWLCENSQTSEGTSFYLPTDKYRYDSLEISGIVMDDNGYERFLIQHGKADPCGLADFRLYRFNSYEEFLFFTNNMKYTDILSIRLGALSSNASIDYDEAQPYIDRVSSSAFPRKTCKSKQGPSEEWEDYQVSTHKDLYKYKLKKNEMIVEFQVHI